MMMMMTVPTTQPASVNRSVQLQDFGNRDTSSLSKTLDIHCGCCTRRGCVFFVQHTLKWANFVVMWTYF